MVRRNSLNIINKIDQAIYDFLEGLKPKMSDADIANDSRYYKEVMDGVTQSNVEMGDGSDINNWLRETFDLSVISDFLMNNPLLFILCCCLIGGAVFYFVRSAVKAVLSILTFLLLLAICYNLFSGGSPQDMIPNTTSQVESWYQTLNEDEIYKLPPPG